MKRFIRYLYEYGQGKRLRNVGFVKVEQKDTDCTLHIHGKGLHMKGGRQLALYLFYGENGECVGIYQGTVDNVNPAINYRLYYTNEDVIAPDNFPKINGIILESDTGRKYAAVWNDSPVDVGHMRVLRPEEVRPQRAEEAAQERSRGPEDDIVPEEESGEAGRAEDLESGREAAQREDVEPGRETEKQEPAAAGEAAMQAESVSQEETAGQSEEPAGSIGAVRQENAGREDPRQEDEVSWKADVLPDGGVVQRMDTLQGIHAPQGQDSMQGQDLTKDQNSVQGQDLTKDQNSVQDQDQDLMQESAMPDREEEGGDDEQKPGVRFQCTKIQRNDMARLPRCEWKWANNSFLLHGYYNYHHLALIQDGDRFWLGVPGIYHPQEAKAASTFGFTEFIPYDDIRVELTDDEKSSHERFGYWCRQVKRPLKM